MPVFRRRGRLRVGVGPGLAELAPGTGHGNTWSHVLAQLSRLDGVELVRRRADVWLASGHTPPAEDQRPLVVQVHEIGWADPDLRAFLDPDFAARLEADTNAAVAAASRVITPSEVARRQVVEACEVRAETVHAVPHGVDHATFKAGLPGGRQLVAGALGRGADLPYVLFVGVIHPRKGFPALREAMAGLAARGMPHLLAMVGGPPPDRRDGSDIVRQAEAELPGAPDRVVRLSNVSEPELAALMAGADAFCLPSLFEGFGLPALEALASGAPSVVSNRGALPDVVGEAALVVEPDARLLEDALHRVLTDSALAARLRVDAVERAAGFSWEHSARGWLEALEAAA